jgi:hypothetical protein
MGYVIGPGEWAKMILLVLVALIILGVYLWVRWVQWGERREIRRLEQAMEAGNQARWDAEQAWVDADQWPLTHYDIYPTEWEMTEDLARLKSMGYDVEWQEHTDEGIAITYSLTPAYEQSRKRSQRRRRQDEEEEEEGAYLS